MKNYVGIDLGTTNSAICSYDGENLRLYKSPDQYDVTPSAIFIDKRGKKYFGPTAYENAAKSPDNAATKFKRMMGTSTPVRLAAVDITMTPEECSAEILKLCFGYLPEEIRNNPDTGTVITVPAAFNQMQKDATMAAAEMAGIGKVALMQEPVAAVMSVMKQRKGDGVFLVFDLGGGTLDIAIAESISGRVSLLAHGGVAMCGGADFDRSILDNIVKPWLKNKFKLPDDLTVNPKFKAMLRHSLYAAEQAKIRLSSKEETVITVPDLNMTDDSGEDIYLDITITRSDLNGLIADKIDESINAARETLDKAGLSPNDVGRIVFVGGPTHYKFLRDRVASELCIEASTEVNPMTAVAEGAAVFAESIDWGSQSRGRKSTRGAISAGGKFDLGFNYVARPPGSRAKILVKLGGTVLAGAEFQVDSLDTGWTSGRVALKDGATIEVMLSKPGDNTFKVFVFDASGGPVSIGDSKIVIARTAALVDAIPSSSSIGIEVTEKGRAELVYLVRELDPLPVKGKLQFRAGESLRAQSTNSLNFVVREGEITDQVRENRPIGVFSIKGSDFYEGIISQGAALICDFEVQDSGQVVLNVSVPSISGNFESHRKFYSRQESQIDFSDASKQIAEEVEIVRERIDGVADKINDPKLDQALQKLDLASSVQSNESDPETAKQAMDNVEEAKKLLADVRKSNIKPIRQMDLDSCVDFFNTAVREQARPTEANSFDNLVRTAQRAIDSNSGDFENHLNELRGRNWQILWRQDFIVVDIFKRLSEETWQFLDRRQHAELVAAGKEAIKADDFEKLRHVVGQLYSIRISSGDDDDMLAIANITRY
ncbi:MAG: Hsp70 family protein [Candidatus Nitrotoga sp.]|nr:Hsp70 family protein [Candidatus Nitrotoga sp.]MDP3497528.1 Hsp70 family protein [Candidatus Nitrotoga sp.]